MKELNMTSLRETLEQLPTSQLDAMLRSELEKEPPDEHAVRLILKVLREREKDYPIESNEQIDKAWEEFQRKTEPAKHKWGSTLLRAASVVIVIGALMLALPQEASARNFFDRIAAWTDSIFELFSPSDSGRSKTEYVFQTDHPGLQELYDTVTELGVTVPVVPMWLEESLKLKECKVSNAVGKDFVCATFRANNAYMIYQLDIYRENVSHEFHKDDSTVIEYEFNGITYNIMRNESLWVVVWTIENIECCIAIDCQEDTLYKILNSIYTMEE